MFSRVYSGAVNGVDAYRIEVEVDCSGGMGQINIVGLPDAAVKESQDRVRSAIRACEILMPAAKKWTVNLAPADTRKEGPFLDLPIAVAILSSTGQLPIERLADFWIVGELGLDGSVRGVNGVLATAMACKASGASNIIVPEANAHEAALLSGLNVYAVSHLKQVCTLLCHPSSMSPIYSSARERFETLSNPLNEFPDFADVKGHAGAKRALMIAAAGRHNVLMVGPPGSGKSMLAQRMPGIMPSLSFDEALELTKLYSVAGKLNEKTGVVSQRPFRNPHHSASLPGLVGGGSFPKPGEISLSHLGVLFLDEMTEFSRSHLDSLRQPMETGSVTISRAQSCFTFPANFLLVGACNPCPCGYRGDQIKYCVCSPYQADRYWSRISGPILDRIDIQIEVGRITELEMASQRPAESSEMMRLKVMSGVERQRDRMPEGNFLFNSQLGQSELRRYCKLSDPVRDVLARAVTQLGLSARAYDRVQRIARTIADLEGSGDIQPMHIAEAVKYRHLRFGTCA